MAYFNHAFQKTFVGTSGFVASSGGEATTTIDKGEFSFFNPKTWLTADQNGPTNENCPLVLVSGSIHQGKDKIGPFAGGYAETVKSKTINPKYISKFYRVDPCSPQQAQVTVGDHANATVSLTSGASVGNVITVTSTTNLVVGMELTIASGTGEFAPFGAKVTDVRSATQFEVAVEPTVALSGATITAVLPASCTKEFLCGETYNLRVDIKGSPVLRTLTRNTYYTAAAYTGCCPDGEIAPTAVNPLIVYVNWAYQLLNSPVINPFIQVEVTYSTDGGTTWLELGDGTSSKANLNLLLAYVQDPSALPANATPADTLAGLIINGAYVDTTFGDCTFYPNDSIIAKLEPVKVYASEVDLNGDPCAFQGLCIGNTCDAVQGKGFGENIIRDLILTEGYMQQPFYTGMDLRIREITNGTDVYDAIDRTSTYTRYYIQHSVPRFNNPSGTFDNDQYLLEIVTDGTDANFETFMGHWLTNANADCVGLETYTCPNSCNPVYPSND